MLNKILQGTTKPETIHVRKNKPWFKKDKTEKTYHVLTRMMYALVNYSDKHDTVFGYKASRIDIIDTSGINGAYASNTCNRAI